MMRPGEKAEAMKLQAENMPAEGDGGNGGCTVAKMSRQPSVDNEYTNINHAQGVGVSTNERRRVDNVKPSNTCGRGLAEERLQSQIKELEDEKSRSAREALIRQLEDEMSRRHAAKEALLGSAIDAISKKRETALVARPIFNQPSMQGGGGGLLQDDASIHPPHLSRMITPPKRPSYHGVEVSFNKRQKSATDECIPLGQECFV